MKIFDYLIVPAVMTLVVASFIWYYSSDYSGNSTPEDCQQDFLTGYCIE